VASAAGARHCHRSNAGVPSASAAEIGYINSEPPAIVTRIPWHQLPRLRETWACTATGDKVSASLEPSLRGACRTCREIEGKSRGKVTRWRYFTRAACGMPGADHIARPLPKSFRRRALLTPCSRVPCYAGAACHQVRCPTTAIGQPISRLLALSSRPTTTCRATESGHCVCLPSALFHHPPKKGQYLVP